MSSQLFLHIAVCLKWPTLTDALSLVGRYIKLMIRFNAINRPFPASSIKYHTSLKTIVKKGPFFILEILTRQSAFEVLDSRPKFFH